MLDFACKINGDMNFFFFSSSMLVTTTLTHLEIHADLFRFFRKMLLDFVQTEIFPKINSFNITFILNHVYV